MPSFAFQFTGSNSAQLKESLTSWYSLRSGIYGQLVIAPVIFFFFLMPVGTPFFQARQKLKSPYYEKPSVIPVSKFRIVLAR